MKLSFLLALASVLILVAGPALASAQEPAPAKKRKVAILVYPGVELLDFAGPGEVFAAAGRGAFDVYTVAESAGTVTSMGFLKIVPDYTIDDCPPPDVLVVPGGSVPAENQRLQAWVAKHARTGELLMSVCNGAALLASSGVLKGLDATTHHNTFGSVQAFEPEVDLLVNRRFVDNGRIVTTAGISAGIDGSLHVVARLLGQEVAQRTATFMEYDWRPEEIAALHAHPGIRYDRQAEHLLGAIEERGLDAAVADYRERLARQTEIDRTVPSEAGLNAMGYGLLNDGKTAQALALFGFVVAAYPASANARDSLSEAQEAAGQRDAALASAREAIALLDAGEGAGESSSSRLREAARARIDRLESGEAAVFVFVCPPCGCACDPVEYEKAGNCPACGVPLVRKAVTKE